ncbi:MAG: dienelactone hydrolase family protein [Muribaculaceae bacterium]|nr:dienelactone hydrolase family protein [Muribaculaceae bacterium]
MMHKKIILSLLIFLTCTFTISSKNISSYVGKVKDGYNFWLYTPDVHKADTISKPVVIFLHGASLCGNNLDRVRHYGPIDAIDKGRDLDAYVIAPQNPGGSWSPKKVMNILDYVTANNRVDLNRVYVIGMSLGGYGTIDLTATYPDRIAAAIAMCGGGTVSNLGNLNDVPLWIVHGTADRAVNIRESDKVVSAMKADNSKTPRLVYNRIPGMNHSQPARMFYLPECYDWLLSHSLLDPNREINSTFDVKSMMANAYKGLKATNPNRKYTRHRKSANKSKSSRRRHSRRNR